MNFAIFAVLLACGLGSSAAMVSNYCAVCRDHTMCKYQGTGPACEDIGEGGVTDEEKIEIVETHNYYRRLVATGQETRGAGGPQPKGSNIMKMRWDDELAQVAQRWADQCTFEHDSCRHLQRFKVGQNIYWNWRMPITTESNWTAAVESWYEEVTMFPPQHVARFKFQSKTGHYTQVLWHNSYLVGCGRRNYGPNKIYVCNYGPAGNWLNSPMYKIGEPCTACPKGTTCNDNLCDGEPKGNDKAAGYPPRPSKGNRVRPTPNRGVEPVPADDANESMVKEYTTPDGKKVKVTVMRTKNPSYVPEGRVKTFTFSGSFDDIAKKLNGLEGGKFDLEQFFQN